MQPLYNSVILSYGLLYEALLKYTLMFEDRMNIVYYGNKISHFQEQPIVIEFSKCPFER